MGAKNAINYSKKDHRQAVRRLRSSVSEKGLTVENVGSQLKRRVVERFPGNRSSPGPGMTGLNASPRMRKRLARSAVSMVAGGKPGARRKLKKSA